MKKSIFLIMMLLTLNITSCNNINNSDNNGSDEMIYDRVIILGVDGAGNNYQYAKTPMIDLIFNKGAKTNNMLTSTPSMSAPCWTSLLHGVVPAKHKTTNAIAGSNPYTNSSYPSIFKVAHDQNPELKLASFCNWAAINIGIVEDDIGVYKHQNSDDASLINDLNNYLVIEKPNLVFVQLDNVDHVGHSTGFGPNNPLYINALEKVDEYVSLIFSTLEDNNMLDGTLLILTSDHGGGGSYSKTSHGGITNEEKYVFFGAYGKTIKTGEISQMEIRDVAAIVTHALGLEKPQSWTAKIPDNLFNDVEGDIRPLGEELNKNTNLIDKLPASVSSYFNFENNYNDIKNNIISEYNLFEGDSYKVAGKNGYGFNTYNGYLKLNNLELDTKDFSFGLFMETADLREDPVILGNKNWASGRNKGLIISARGGSYSDIKFNLGDGSNRFDIELDQPNNFLNGWSHILFTVDRTNNIISYYANFELIKSFSLPDNFKNFSFDSGLAYVIGNDSTEQFWYGLPAIIDDVCFFDKALTTEEVTELKNIYK